MGRNGGDFITPCVKYVYTHGWLLGTTHGEAWGIFKKINACVCALVAGTTHSVYKQRRVNILFPGVSSPIHHQLM